MPVLGPLLGFNDNVAHRGATYHVQTEDLGPRRKQVVTHVFADGGRVVHSKKTSYEHLPDEEGLAEAIRAWMTHQHQTVVSTLRRGEFDEAIGLPPRPPRLSSVAPPGATVRSPEDRESVLPASVPPIVVEVATPGEIPATVVPTAFPSLSPSVFAGLAGSLATGDVSSLRGTDSSAVAMSTALPLVRTAESSAAPPSEPPLTLRRGGLSPDLDAPDSSLDGPAPVASMPWRGFGERFGAGPSLADLVVAYLEG